MASTRYPPEPKIVTVQVEQIGAHWYGSSRDLPRLHVGGQTPETVRDSAARAIVHLFKMGRDADVQAELQSVGNGEELQFLVVRA